MLVGMMRHITTATPQDAKPLALQAAILFALAGFCPAQAEVVFSGEAKMGLVYDGKATQALAGTRMTATFSHQTDGGLEFGIILDLEQGANGVRSPFTDEQPRAQVYISGGNSTLTMGKGTRNAVQQLRGDPIYRAD